MTHKTKLLTIIVSQNKVTIKYNESVTKFIKTMLFGNGFTRVNEYEYVAPLNERSSFFCQINGLIL